MSTTPPTEPHEAIWTPDGHKRILNLKPSDPRKLRAYRGLESPPVIPLASIQPFDDWPAAVKIKDQNGYGACNGHATATAVEFARAMAGMPPIPLSAWYVYGSLVHGRDTGSNITDALQLIEKNGVAPESDVKYGDFSGRYSSAVEVDATRYQCEIGGSLQTWEEIVSFIALRGAVNLSVRATNGWSGRLDANGCPPVGRGPGNHAVMCGGGIKRLSNGELAIRMANSWSTQWGLDGFCWLTRAHIESGTWFECLYVRAVARDPQDTTPKAA